MNFGNTKSKISFLAIFCCQFNVSTAVVSNIFEKGQRLRFNTTKRDS